MSKHWFDSFPGIDLDRAHPRLDFYGTPYGGPEDFIHSRWNRIAIPFDCYEDPHAPYTTVSQNRGGIA